MISRAQAEGIARGYLASRNGVRAFSRKGQTRPSLGLLRPCPLGWAVLVRCGQAGDLSYGEALHVIAAADGSILRFPPALPPAKLLENLERYRSRAVSIPVVKSASKPDSGLGH